MHSIEHQNMYPKSCTPLFVLPVWLPNLTPISYLDCAPLLAFPPRLLRRSFACQVGCPIRPPNLAPQLRPTTRIPTLVPQLGTNVAPQFRSPSWLLNLTPQLGFVTCLPNVKHQLDVSIWLCNVRSRIGFCNMGFQLGFSSGSSNRLHGLGSHGQPPVGPLVEGPTGEMARALGVPVNVL